MRSSRIHRAPLLLAALFTVVVGVGGAAGVYYAAERREGDVGRVDVGADILVPREASGPARNYLLVGSDSRENFDPEGTGGDGCDCSDTLMVLRADPDYGPSLLSIPRDLWVDIAGRDRSAKINAAYGYGPETVIRTVREELGIPIHHYVEIDFDGFVKLVDAIGGVEVCVDHLSRDRKTGLELQPGCQVVDGVTALQFARSRSFEEFIGDRWVGDRQWDYGRVRRQQAFVTSAIDGVMEQILDDPRRLGDLVAAVSGLIKVDAQTDLVTAAAELSGMAGAGVRTYTLPVDEVRRGGQDALELKPEAEEILDFFRGEGPPPAVDED